MGHRRGSGLMAAHSTIIHQASHGSLFALLPVGLFPLKNEQCHYSDANRTCTKHLLCARLCSRQNYLFFHHKLTPCLALLTDAFVLSE